MQRALEILDANNGEIWAKLDAGTEAYYQQVARSAVPFQRILDNLLLAARVRPIVIQSLFMRLRRAAAAAGRAGGLLRPAQRDPGRAAAASSWCRSTPSPGRRPRRWVAPLSDAEVDALAELVRRRTGLPVAAFYGSPSPPGKGQVRRSCHRGSFAPSRASGGSK